MKRIVSIFLIVVLVFTLTGFSYNDNPSSVRYLCERGVMMGDNNGNLALDDNITVEQLCIMLCREQKIQDACATTEAYQRGWIDTTGLLNLKSPMVLKEFYNIAFKAKKIPIYNAELYGDTKCDSSVLRTAKNISLPTKTKNEYVSRLEAANILYKIFVNDFEIKPPPIANRIKIDNVDEAMLNDYLVQLAKLPSGVLDSFNHSCWRMKIDVEYLHRITNNAASCVGASFPSERTICVVSPDSVIHEFGHFVDYYLGRPSKSGIFSEAKNSGLFLRKYAQTSPEEYFAEVFVFWAAYDKEDNIMLEFKSVCPETYKLFLEIEKFF